jgi:hypothetical protein
VGIPRDHTTDSLEISPEIVYPEEFLVLLATIRNAASVEFVIGIPFGMTMRSVTSYLGQLISQLS